MQAHEEDLLSLEELYSSGAENVAFTKILGILRSTSAIISLVSSSVLIWILNGSNARFSSIYHRILLGMCVGDILLSLGFAHFNAAAPSDVDYWAWNARGNQATCSAVGFVSVLGATVSIFYACSLNLYSLAAVKYNKRDSYIRTKIEPFLHAVPIGWGFVLAITLLVNRNLNDRGGGACIAPVYDPPHCIGYADGEVRERFEIPCGRGSDGAVLFNYLAVLLSLFAAPIIIGVSLWMIYRAVKHQEQVIARYGTNALAANTHTYHTSNDTNMDEDGGSNHHYWLDQVRSSIRMTVSSLQNRRSIGQSSSASNRRVVMRRAFAFTISYFLTWSFFFIGACFEIAGKEWPLAMWYLAAIFNPLQGFFNLCIFLQPTVLKIKSRGGIGTTWCQAVTEAIRYSGRGDKALGRAEGRGDEPANIDHQPQMAQPIQVERTDSQRTMGQTQGIVLEAREETQQSPGVDGGHDTDVQAD